MVTPWQQPAIKSDETENVIREYMEKMRVALENESARLKEQAEQDAVQIVARAREEADSIIAEAKQKARQESDDIVNRLKQEAERLLEESREKAVSEGRQAADEIIQDAREKAAGILTDVIEHGINTVESDFIRTVLSAKNVLEGEKSRLLNDAGKELIIVEKEPAEASDIQSIITSINDSEDQPRTKRITPGITVNS